MSDTVSTETLDTIAEERPYKTEVLAQWWHRLRENKLAFVSLVFLIMIHIAVAFAPQIASYQPDEIDPRNTFANPSSIHLLGTDESGRDVLSRLLYGGRISLLVGLVAVSILTIVGTAIGALGGFFGRLVDTILMRLTDAFMAVPPVILLLTALVLFGTNLLTIIIVIGMTSWMGVARIVRSEILRWRGQDFVLAAKALGASGTQIVISHLIPQAVPSIIVAATLGVGRAILIESALSYLGLGIQPPTPSWGNMLSNSQFYLWKKPILTIYPGVLILLTVLSYNFLGDGLRDALDPRYFRKRGNKS